MAKKSKKVKPKDKPQKDTKPSAAENKKQKKIDSMSFEDKLWETAELLIGAVSPSEYKNIALGLMFVKFISDRYEERRKEIENETSNPKSEIYSKTDEKKKYWLNLKDQYSSKGVFYLKEGDRWNDLKKIISTEKNLGIKIDAMLDQIEKDNPSLTGVLPKVFSGAPIPNENLQQLVELFDSITTHDSSKDAFGRIYEYFMRNFSKKLGEKGGEFFTPESIVRLLVEILEPYQGIVYDPTCGSGGMFVQSYKFLQAHKDKNQNTKQGISIYGVEKKNEVLRICKMNLAIRGIESKNIVLGDCFLDHPHSKLKANRVIANPPFNLREWGYEKLKEDARFQKYGIPTPSKAGGNYAFMEHMLYHLDEKDGRMGIVLANGSMASSGTEGKIRQNMVEDDILDCMVALPTNLFFTVTIPACLWFFTKNKDDGKTRKRKGETLFIDARKIFTKIDRVLNELSVEQIERIAGTYRSYIGEKGYPKYKDIAGYCKVVTKDEIAKNNYVLTPGRYVGAEDIEDDDEPFEEKMKKLTAEYAKLSEESTKLDKEIRKNLKEIGFEI
ncbi:class I SAM-dependent DNA methyltransferase [Nitrosarchaeum sp. AC2]|uniref:type I restriction-modification system subunit M n=1 Tax=Nitrosarchaeum sp. AC2 TaxID=2259673 RepID=UPI0015C8BC24|nr:class I SAM-dependent DNA methyltransferase [Nitrosarchaeum sp. AC2]QLH11011.1 SAM-dependent DNA methyltransferase [Nitrosarchaeum sp. AC2]